MDKETKHDIQKDGFEKRVHSLEGIHYELKVLPEYQDESKKIIAKTIEKLPGDIIDRILDEATFVVMDDKGCVSDLYFIKSECELKKEVIGKGKYKTTVYSFTIPAIFLDLNKHKNDDGRMDTIAHEIAHVILGHGSLKEGEDKNYEREADDLSESWGFNRFYSEEQLKRIDEFIKEK